ncbi:pyrokinin-1 receptor-like [Tribolium madens]|uniref:pyrokinin-1 receptor-like n=1 Tax=Tribolium madens TaxID=41895 RepID=UPI001CF73335|nr:pyrokinin-1 receptor-like [Tribolium madens]XP_044263084.1 pyrokinin-1 receptor-like [Tribolium madens]XP_044263085.1 pyrokinin-1 receptor-like [Tribolium madens]
MTHLGNDTFNLTGFKINVTIRDDATLYPPSLVIPVTVVYGVIFVTGVIGNVSTCIVISCNKSMHTATNYYLFSLAVSDMLLLISGLPPEMYRLWSPETYVFGEAFCILQGFAAETSANATVLTITAFTVERYVAICHPFVSHTMSKLSRAIRHIIVIWVVALCLAAPQAIQFGVEYELKDGVQYSRCTVVSNFFQHAFEISTFLFFVGPITLITVLYVLIGIQLRKSRLSMTKKRSLGSSGSSEQARNRNQAAQKRVVNMLIAVVVAFFICWAPFHAQRLMAVYLSTASKEAQEMTFELYMVLMYASGILYFLSTTINPVLYHIMSNKFREAFKKTLKDFCRRDGPRHAAQTYSVLSRCPPLNRHFERPSSVTLDNHMKEELHLKKSTTHRSYNFLGCNKVKQDSSTINECQDLHTIVLSESKPPTPGSKTSQRSDKFRIFRVFGQQKRPVKFFREKSVDSGHTISNSSLQDVDKMEHSSLDLVKYMEEINEDIT